MDIKELKKIGAQTLSVSLEVCQNSLKRGATYGAKLDFYSAIKEFTTVIELFPKLTELTKNLNLPLKIARDVALLIVDFTCKAYLGRSVAYTQIGEKEKGNADVIMAEKLKNTLNVPSQDENHKLSSSSQTPSSKTTVSQSAQSTNSSNHMVYEDFEYILIDSGIEIKKYTGSATSVIIPKYIDDLPVTSIGIYAFLACKSLTSIQIPNSITSIGSCAFYDCKSLTSIQIPNSVTSIGKGAFEYCESLTSIQIPNSVTSIGSGAFYDCKSLTSIQIPNSVTSIGEEAFWYCKLLTVVLLLNPNTIIGKDVLKDCHPALKILRGPIAEPVVEAPKTTVDSHYNQEEKKAEKSSKDKSSPVIGCLFWIVVLLFILNFLFG